MKPHTLGSLIRQSTPPFKSFIKRFVLLFTAVLLLVLWIEPSIAADISLPGVSFSTGQSVGNADPEQVGVGLQILALLTLFSLAPSLLIMVTSFTRVVVVMSFVRQAMGLGGQTT